MTSTTLDPDHLLRMTQQELDDLFRSVADPGPVPDGDADGTMILARDRTLESTVAKLAHHIAWQGKVFDARKGELLNKIGPLGHHAVRAKVYQGESWFDGNPAIILDYSETSLVAHWVRDEIRQVSPGLYLGVVYWKHDRILNFCLRFAASGAG